MLENEITSDNARITLERARDKKTSIKIFNNFGKDIYLNIYKLILKNKLNVSVKQYCENKFNGREIYCSVCNVLIGYTIGKYFKDYYHCDKSCYYKNSKLRSETLYNCSDKLSRSLKLAIKNGTFTPAVTNSWARSRIIIDTKKFRSSWEALFSIINRELLYEKTRISYVFNEDTKTYITDFTDDVNKIIYEIKPDSLLDDEKNIAKFLAAREWSTKNLFTFKIISQQYFIDNIKTIQLEYDKIKHLIDDNSNRKMSKTIKIFERLYDESSEY
jgi:hypothetical protein